MQERNVLTHKQKSRTGRDFCLFLCFLVLCLLFAPFAKLQKLDFSFDFLLVFA